MPSSAAETPLTSASLSSPPLHGAAAVTPGSDCVENSFPRALSSEFDVEFSVIYTEEKGSR